MNNHYLIKCLGPKLDSLSVLLKAPHSPASNFSSDIQQKHKQHFQPAHLTSKVGGLMAPRACELSTLS